jgi:hypothetical protein
MSIRNSMKRCGQGRKIRAQHEHGISLQTAAGKSSGRAHLAVRQFGRIHVAGVCDCRSQRGQELLHQVRQERDRRLLRHGNVPRLLGRLRLFALQVAPVLVQLRVLSKLKL